MQKTFVYTTVQIEGYHNFPESASLPQFATGDELDVSFLSNNHSHIFIVKVWVEVNHNNRDIEFLQLRRRLLQHYGTKPIQFGNRACEMIAEDLYKTISQFYPNVEVRIDVAEDNFNGAYLEFEQ